MDIEKLIERLRKHRVIYKTNYDEFSGGACTADCVDAATALSTLQDKNEKLRAELEQERAHRLHAEQHADAFLEDCKRLNAELGQVKRCIEIVEHQRDEAIEELENYMVQDVLDGNEPCGICAKASDTPCECCDPKWRGPGKED